MILMIHFVDKYKINIQFDPQNSLIGIFLSVHITHAYRIQMKLISAVEY